MSAEDIYKKLLVSNQDIGLATVYRVLTQFEAAGLVTRHHFEGGMAVFELNHGAHHDHIVCVDCGRVEEFIDGGIEERQQAVAKRLGFEISDHSLILYGHCRKSTARIKSGRKQRASCAPPARAFAFAGCRRRRAREHVARMGARLLADVDTAQHARDLIDALGRRTVFSPRCE